MNKINFSATFLNKLILILVLGNVIGLSSNDPANMFKVMLQNNLSKIGDDGLIKTATKMGDNILLQGFRKGLNIESAYEIFCPNIYINGSPSVKNVSNEQTTLSETVIFLPVSINKEHNEMMILLEKSIEEEENVYHLSTLDQSQAQQTFDEIMGSRIYYKNDMGALEIGSGINVQNNEFVRYYLLSMEYKPYPNRVWVKLNDFLSGTSSRRLNENGELESKAVQFSSLLYLFSQNPELQKFLKKMNRLNMFYIGELANALGDANYDTAALTKRADISNEVWGVKTAVLPAVAPEFAEDAKVVDLLVVAKHPIENDVRVLLFARDNGYYSGIRTNVNKKQTSLAAAMEKGIALTGAGFILDSVEMSKIDSEELANTIKEYKDNESKASRLVLPYMYKGADKIATGVALWALPYKTKNELNTIQNLFLKHYPDAQVNKNMVWVRLHDLIDYLSNKIDILPGEGTKNVPLSYIPFGGYEAFVSPDNQASVQFMKYLLALEAVNNESSGLDVETGLLEI